MGAGITVNRRELIGRIFSSNTLIPTKSLITFTTIKEVGDYFGINSVEYSRAVFYFSWVSKNVTSPQKLGFYRWVEDDQAPTIFGGRLTAAIGEFQGITTGAFSLTLGTTQHNITGLDFSAATTLADVAAALQVAIRAADTDNQWDQCTVTYDSTRGAFIFVGGEEVADVIATGLAGTGTEILHIINWAAVDGAILSNGSLKEEPVEAVTESAATSDNFGSFLFLDTLDDEDIVDIAEWNATQNVKFMYLVPVFAADATTLAGALEEIAGVGVTLNANAAEFPEQLPMNILASTDYDRVNAVQNYMFQQANLTATVTTDADADIYDALDINYYGVTQTAGQYLAFYQKGILMGLATDPTDMNTYANEIWLKDAIGSSLMELLLALPELPANSRGRGQILAVLQSVITEALVNGTISVGKDLTPTQKAYITQVTGDDRAWHQVQSLGYWVDCSIDAVDNEANYILVYSKDDVIRKIVGQDILI